MDELTEIQRAARRLVGRSSLVEIRLFSSNAELLSFSGPEETRLGELSVGIAAHGEVGGDAAIYTLAAELPLHTGTPEAPEMAAIFQVTFGALYKLDDEVADASEQEREAFGQCVAGLALWPYVRAEIGHLADAMHCPILMTLPVLTQRDLLVASTAQ